MRTLYVLIVSMLLACLCLWAGRFNKIKKLSAFILAFFFMGMGGIFLACSVLPGNFIYGDTVVNLSNSKLNVKAAHSKTIALTFDDGPYEPHTSNLLDKLQQKQIKATFFIIAEEAEKHPEVVKRIAAEGHTVALHQYKHMDSLKLSKDELKNSIQKGKDSIEKITGKEVKFWRPCHGFRDRVVMDVAKDLGLTIVNWDNIPRDWTLISSDEIVRRVVQGANPGSIVLLHDGDSPTYTHPRIETVNAVEKIVDVLNNQGYTFVAIE